MMAAMLLWIIFAFMTAAGLAAVLWPLLRSGGDRSLPDAAGGAAQDVAVYRDQLQELERDLARGVVSEADAEAGRREISRRLLAADSRTAEDAGQTGNDGGRLRNMTAIATAVLVPVLGLTVYLSTGSPTLEDQPLAKRLAAPVSAQSMPELLARVEAHLRTNPNDLRGWSVIGPVYMRMRRYADAADAFRRVLNIGPPDAAVYASYGEALMLSQEGLVTVDAREAFTKANQLSPEQPKPRYFLALAAFQEGRKDEAIAAWKALLAEAPADAPWRETVESQIARAEGRSTAATVPALSQDTVSAAQEMAPEERQKMIEGMVDRLAQRLSTEGGAIEEWLRLARAQAVLGRKKDAGSTLATARAKFADTPTALTRIDELGRTMQIDGSQ